MIGAAKLVAQIVAFFLTATTSEHTPATECSTYKEIQYCYYQGQDSSQNLVYFMHGFGNDIRAWSWNHVSGKIENHWKKQVKPHVVTISFNKFWLYHETLRAKEKLQEFTTWLEKEKMHDNVDKRYLYGDSMGGYNAINWIDERPGFFDALALICPAISKSMTDKPNDRYTGSRWISPLADKLFYNSSVNSDLLMREKIARVIQKNSLDFIYLAAIPTDEMGFYPGNKYLKRQIAKHGPKNFIWEEHSGRHCIIAPKKLASLLSQ
jgi:pimeloyl-ACP methyl ester carboxylesterase